MDAHTHVHIQAQEKNNHGDYNGAKSCGRAALGCNICGTVAFVVTIVLAFAGIATMMGVFFGIFPSSILNYVRSTPPPNYVRPTPPPNCCYYNWVWQYCTKHCNGITNLNECNIDACSSS